MNRRFLQISTMAVLLLSLITSGCGQTVNKKVEVKAETNTAAEKTAEKSPEKAKFVPDKTITVALPAGPGGSSDMLARAVEKVWLKYCPQPLNIIGKPGGGGVEAAAFVSRAKPDGYTMELGYGSGQDIVMPHLEKIEYDPFRDLIPVARLSIHTVAVLVVDNSSFKTITDVINWAKKENKPVTAAVSATGNPHDLTVRAIGKLTGITVTPVPHSGGAQSIATMLGGNTTIGTGVPCEALIHLKSGKARPIAMATPERDPILKDVPTLIEQGINFSVPGIVKGIALPPKTPKEIIDYYAEVFKKVCDDPEFKKIMNEIGQPIQYQNPDEFAKFIRQAYDEYGKTITDLGLGYKK